MTLRWLFLDLNSYFASVEQQVQPALRDRPMIVAPMLSDSTCAIAASLPAKRLGIKTGTPVWQARQICPDLAVVAARPGLYVEYHHRILAVIERHLPIHKVWSIDEAACRLTGRDQQAEAACALARAIKTAICAEVGVCLTSSVGIAPSGLLAKIASDMHKPDGLTVLPLADLPGRLLELSLTDLPGIGANMERRLHQRAIHSVADLWGLDDRRARQIWGGVQGARFLHALRGEDIVVVDHQHKRTIGHSHVLAPHLRPMAAARGVARELAAKAAERLRRADYLAAAVYLGVRAEHGPRWGSDFRLKPTDDSTVILQAVDQLWARLPLDPQRARIKKIAVTLFHLTPRQAATGDLFDWASQQRRPAAGLSQAIDCINHRYGRHTITMGPRPDRAADFIGTKIAFSRVPDQRL